MEQGFDGAAQCVAKSLGLEEVQADLLPEQKVQAVEALVETYGRVARVGDAVNDAPAMAHATLGIAMGLPGATPPSRRPISPSCPTTSRASPYRFA